jgi:Fis family transcriptional regulator
MSAAKDSPPLKRRKATKTDPPPLKDSAGEAIEHFLKTLDGETCSDLYDMVLQQVEAPLFKAVLEYTQHNQSHAATMLGLNRGTLRKKLRQHGLVNEPEPPKRKRSSRTPKSPASKAATNKTAINKTAIKRKR